MICTGASWDNTDAFLGCACTNYLFCPHLRLLLLVLVKVNHMRTYSCAIRQSQLERAFCVPSGGGRSLKNNAPGRSAPDRQVLCWRPSHPPPRSILCQFGMWWCLGDKGRHGRGWAYCSDAGLHRISPAILHAVACSRRAAELRRLTGLSLLVRGSNWFALHSTPSPAAATSRQGKSSPTHPGYLALLCCTKHRQRTQHDPATQSLHKSLRQGIGTPAWHHTNQGLPGRCAVHAQAHWGMPQPRPHERASICTCGAPARHMPCIWCVLALQRSLQVYACPAPGRCHWHLHPPRPGSACSQSGFGGQAEVLRPMLHSPPECWRPVRSGGA